MDNVHWVDRVDWVDGAAAVGVGVDQQTAYVAAPAVLSFAQATGQGQVTLIKGDYVSGSWESLKLYDDNRLIVRRQSGPSPNPYLVEVQVEATLDSASPTNLWVMHVGRMQTGGQFAQEIGLYNWTTSSYEWHSATPSRCDQKHAVQIPSERLAEFVNQSLQVRMRYRVKASGITASPDWVHETDRVIWVYDFAPSGN